MELKDKLALAMDLCEVDFVKGTYKDTPENRKKGRVGAQYGGGRKEDEKSKFDNKKEGEGTSTYHTN